ncbi:hypothetical protein HDU78_009024 [Chytriomyces hyalinus]|nr:hypothetical protein HDU78_009024 [Chytriomyces hyalinus]
MKSNAFFLLLSQLPHYVQALTGNALVRCYNPAKPYDELPVQASMKHFQLKEMSSFNGKIYSLDAKDSVYDILSGSSFYSNSSCGPSSAAAYIGNSILITCSADNSIVQLNSAGSIIARLTSTSKGQRFVNPVGIAVDGEGNAYFGAMGNKSMGVLAGEIFFIKKPSEGSIASQILKSSNEALDYGGAMELINNGSTLLITTRQSRLIKKYAIESNTVKIKKSQVYADLNKLVLGKEKLLSGPSSLRFFQSNLYVVDGPTNHILIFTNSGQDIFNIRFRNKQASLSLLSIAFNGIGDMYLGASLKGNQRRGVLFKISGGWQH